ncbi:MAG: hypothetical protein M3R38_35430 [Actinomycetota bacterium]|nr:hypothetical protein [Actinomycetota bacterium]
MRPGRSTSGSPWTEHSNPWCAPREEYDALARALLVRARELARGFPSPAGVGREALADSCSPSEIAGLTGLLFMYQRFICDVTIDMVRLKRALDGPEAATVSPFPIP